MEVDNVDTATQLQRCEDQLISWRSKSDELEETIQLLDDALQEVVSNISEHCPASCWDFPHFTCDCVH
jgi:hypothetical protein